MRRERLGGLEPKTPWGECGSQAGVLCVEISDVSSPRLSFTTRKPGGGSSLYTCTVQGRVPFSTSVSEPGWDRMLCLAVHSHFKPPLACLGICCAYHSLAGSVSTHGRLQHSQEAGRLTNGTGSVLGRDINMDVPAPLHPGADHVASIAKVLLT